jgi:hypothetical protein
MSHAQSSIIRAKLVLNRRRIYGCDSFTSAAMLAYPFGLQSKIFRS